MNAENKSTDRRPAWIRELEQAFGGPSQAAFGTAVFFELFSGDKAAPGQVALEQRALTWYQFFCGPTWEKFGPDNWLGTWESVYIRSADSASINDELEKIDDPQAQRSASTMLDGSENPQAARNALKQAFDSTSIEELQVFRIGDGGSMSGILIAGRRVGGESAFVAFLLD